MRRVAALPQRAAPRAASGEARPASFFASAASILRGAAGKGSGARCSSFPTAPGASRAPGGALAAAMGADGDADAGARASEGGGAAAGAGAGDCRGAAQARAQARRGGEAQAQTRALPREQERARTRETARPRQTPPSMAKEEARHRRPRPPFAWPPTLGHPQVPSLCRPRGPARPGPRARPGPPFPWRGRRPSPSAASLRRTGPASATPRVRSPPWARRGGRDRRRLAVRRCRIAMRRDGGDALGRRDDARVLRRELQQADRDDADGRGRGERHPPALRLLGLGRFRRLPRTAADGAMRGGEDRAVEFGRRRLARLRAPRAFERGIAFGQVRSGRHVHSSRSGPSALRSFATA